MAMASTTKIMTCILALEEGDLGRGGYGFRTRRLQPEGASGSETGADLFVWGFIICVDVGIL